MNKLMIAGLAALTAVSVAEAKPFLTGETSHPKDSIYIQGEKVEVFFTITGLEPKKPGPNLKLRICDDYDRELWKAEHKTLADEHGADMVRIGYGIPQKDLGFYRVYAELSDGTKLVSPWSTQHDGELTYAVVRNPKDRPEIDESVLMFYGNPDPRLMGPLPPFHGQDGFDQPWPEECKWACLDRKGPGSYANNPDNAKIKFYRQVMMVNGGFNRWSKEDYEKVFDTSNWKDYDGKQRLVTRLTPYGETVYTNMMTHFVRNYRKQFIDRQPRMYEITSEMEPTEDGRLTMADLIRYYQLSYEVIHREDPEGIVCGPGYGPWGGHVEAFLRAGLGKYIDAITGHSYWNPTDPEPSDLVGTVRRTDKMIAEAAGRKIPVYDTESGYATRDLKEREFIQFKHITRMNLIFAGEGYKAVSLFTNSDYRNERGFGYNFNLWLSRTHGRDYSDYGPCRTSPKQVVPAQSAMTWFVANHVSCGDIPFLGKTVWGYVFKNVKTGKIDLAVWDWARDIRDPNRFNLKVGRKSITVADHMGNLRTETCNEKGELPVALYDMPLYILDVDPAIWESPDGERGQLAKAFAEKLAAERRAKGVELGTTRPCLAPDGGAGVEVTVVDVSEQPNAGTVEVAFKGRPETKRTAKYALGPKESKAFVIPLGTVETDPLRYETLEVRATMDDGRKAEGEEKLNFFVIPKAKGFAIDGDFAKWERIPSVKLDPKRHCTYNADLMKGERDQHGSCAFAWDEKGLLFYFDIRDDIYNQPKKGKMVWAADAVQIALCRTFRYEKTGNTLIDFLAEAHTLYTFGQTPEPFAYRHISYDREAPQTRQTIFHPVGPVDLNDGKSGYEMKGRATKLDDGTWREQYEIRIPWHAVNKADPKTGDCLSFGLCLNDFDNEGYGTYTCLGAYHLFFTEQFGALILGE